MPAQPDSARVNRTPLSKPLDIVQQVQARAGCAAIHYCPLYPEVLGWKLKIISICVGMQMLLVFDFQTGYSNLFKPHSTPAAHILRLRSCMHKKCKPKNQSSYFASVPGYTCHTPCLWQYQSITNSEACLTNLTASPDVAFNNPLCTVLRAATAQIRGCTMLSPGMQWDPHEHFRLRRKHKFTNRYTELAVCSIPYH